MAVHGGNGLNKADRCQNDDKQRQHFPTWTKKEIDQGFYYHDSHQGHGKRNEGNLANNNQIHSAKFSQVTLQRGIDGKHYPADHAGDKLKRHKHNSIGHGVLAKGLGTKVPTDQQVVHIPSAEVNQIETCHIKTEAPDIF